MELCFFLELKFIQVNVERLTKMIRSNAIANEKC